MRYLIKYGEDNFTGLLLEVIKDVDEEQLQQLNALPRALEALSVMLADCMQHWAYTYIYSAAGSNAGTCTRLNGRLHYNGGLINAAV